ncbi:MAG: HEAT repeat domain-containing protein [Planctomycetota bacterium]|nr:HEAT repeat domain-containing protein [Planctomycetota bacterium]
MPKPEKKRGILMVTLVILATAGIGALTWYINSFQRYLTDEQILEHLDPETEAPPRSIQHALEQLYARLGSDYEGRERFREPVVALADSEHVEIRRMVAWVMGCDETEVYRAGLARMLADEDAGVQLNAACALSNFNDPRARPRLLEGLGLFEVGASVSGTLDIKVEVGEPASLGVALGVVGTGDRSVDVRTPMNGFVEGLPKGKTAEVGRGEAVLVVAPGPKVILGVLRGLRFVGRLEDVPRLEPFASGAVTRMGDDIAEAARAAIAAIKQRGK